MCSCVCVCGVEYIASSPRICSINIRAKAVCVCAVPHFRRNNFHEYVKECVSRVAAVAVFRMCDTGVAVFCFFFRSLLALQNGSKLIRSCTYEYNARKRNGVHINKSNWNIPFIRLYARLLLLYLVGCCLTFRLYTYLHFGVQFRQQRQGAKRGARRAGWSFAW